MVRAMRVRMTQRISRLKQSTAHRWRGRIGFRTFKRRMTRRALCASRQALIAVGWPTATNRDLPMDEGPLPIRLRTGLLIRNHHLRATWVLTAFNPVIVASPPPPNPHKKGFTMRTIIALLLLTGFWVQAHATCYDSRTCTQMGLPDPNPGPFGPWDGKFTCTPNKANFIVSSYVDPSESPNKAATYRIDTAGKVFATYTKCGGTYQVFPGRRVGFKVEPAMTVPVMAYPTDLLGDPITTLPMIVKPCGYYTLETPCSYPK